MNLDTKNLCLKPWRAIHLSSDGRFAPCMSIEKSFSYAKKENNLQEAWLSPIAGELRYGFVTDRKNECCEYCQLQERVGKSERQDFFSLSLRDGIMTIDQLLSHPNPQYVSLEFNTDSFGLMNLKVLNDWLPTIESLTLSGIELMSHTQLPFVLELVANANLKQTFVLTMESDCFECSTELRALLKKIPRLNLRAILIKNATMFDSLVLKNIAMLAHDLPGNVTQSALLEINALNASYLPVILQQFNVDFPQIVLVTNIVPAHAPLSVANMSASLKSEIAHQVKFINTTAMNIANKSVIRELLDWMNLQPNDAQMAKDLVSLAKLKEQMTMELPAFHACRKDHLENR